MKTRSLPPHAYHMAEAANWSSIQQHGLIPASLLLKQAKLTTAERQRLDTQQRPDHTTLPGGVQIRDQRPMPPKALLTCLIGITPAQWYALLNARVFFWFDPERLNRQRAACGDRPQVVLTVDAPALVEAYRKFASVTPINTGNARRKPSRRGAATFVPIETWLQSAWQTEADALGTTVRKPTHRPVELTMAAPIRDLSKYVLDVRQLPAHHAFIPAI